MFSGVLQESGFPVLAIVGVTVLCVLVLCLVVALVWHFKKKSAKSRVGELMSLLLVLQLLAAAFVDSSVLAVSTAPPNFREDPNIYHF